MSLYNEDELVPPTWVNQEFVKTVLTTYEKNKNVEITNMDLSPASVKGDHYASVMFRCKVNYKVGKSNKSKSLVIKTLPEMEGMKRELLMESQMFETEIKMYTETLPEIERILGEHGEPTKLSAKIFYHSLEPHKVIVLEDLCDSGYDTVRFRYLNEEEVKAVYRKIAKLHAVSYMLGQNEETAHLVHQFQNGVFNSNLAMARDMISNGIRSFGDLLSQHEEFQKYYEKFIPIGEEMSEACKDLNNAFIENPKNTEDICVLNHGDFHMRNIMFKFDRNNHLEDLIMVDYQLSIYAPSTIDTIYSQFMILSSDLRQRRQEFMLYYFSEFIRILKKIKFQGKLPLYSQFQRSSLKYRHYTIFCLSVLLPMVLSFFNKTKEELEEFETTEYIESPDMIAQSYGNTDFIKDIRRFMPQLLVEGYFD